MVTSPHPLLQGPRKGELTSQMSPWAAMQLRNLIACRTWTFPPICLQFGRKDTMSHGTICHQTILMNGVRGKLQQVEMCFV